MKPCEPVRSAYTVAWLEWSCLVGFSPLKLFSSERHCVHGIRVL